MQTVDRIFVVLDLLKDKKEGCSISDISQSLDLPISTVHRLLKSLKKNEYVVQDINSKRYRLGLKILHLSMNLLNNIDVRRVARIHMENLCQKYGQVIFLTVMQGKKFICIDSHMPSINVSFFVKVGSEMPINAAVASQSILAFKEESIVDQVLEKSQIKQYTDKTLIDHDSIKDKLDFIRKEGYGICDEELERGVIAIAVPIKNHYGEVIASITMVGMKQEELVLKKRINDLIITGKNISKELGYIEYSTLV